MSEQYWIRAGEKPRGPCSSRQLDKLLRTGKIKPHFEVSVDQVNWITAERAFPKHFQTGGSNAGTAHVSDDASTVAPAQPDPNVPRRPRSRRKVIVLCTVNLLNLLLIAVLAAIGIHLWKAPPDGHIASLTNISATGNSCTVTIRWPLFGTSSFEKAYVVVSPVDDETVFDQHAPASAITMSLFNTDFGNTAINNVPFHAAKVLPADKPSTVTLQLPSAKEYDQLCAKLFASKNDKETPVSNFIIVRRQ